MYTYDRRRMGRCIDPGFMPGPRGDFPPGAGPEFVGGPLRRGGRFIGERMWSGRARRGQLRESILRLLADEPMNGYQIMTALAEKTMGAWNPSPGAIYPCLSQLEDEGLIIATQSEGQKMFTLTEAGKAALDQVGEEPWAGPTGVPPQRASMMEQFRHLGSTINYAARTATPEQMGAIATQLESTRKALLTIMAEAE